MIQFNFMIYYLLALVNRLTGTTEIEYSKLENAFYAYLKLINKYFDSDLKYNFRDQLDILIDENPEVFIEDGDIISIINDDLNLAYSEITTIEAYSDNNFQIGDFVTDFTVIKALGIPISITEYQELFDLNNAIYDMYCKLASLNDNPESINYLKQLVISLKEKVNNLNIKDFTILEACFKLLNSEILPDMENVRSRDSWYILLFTTDKKTKKILGYDKLEKLCLNLSAPDDFDDDGDEEYEIIQEAKDILAENIYIEDDKVFFLTHFFVKLKDYVATLPNSPLKQKLNLYLYKLLSTRYFTDTESYYLEKKTFQDLTLPLIPPENYDKETVESFKQTAMESALSLDFSDEELAKDPQYIEKTIIYCLFLNTYLTLSQNEDSKKEMINLIITSRFYKQKGYEEISRYIDNLAFNNIEPKLTKN